MRESLTRKRARTAEIVERLKREYPDSRCSLEFRTPFQLLVATMLSAQCTDERVNMVTPVLFSRFPDAESMAAAPVDEIAAIIRSTGFFNSKSKNISNMAKTVVVEYGGEIPMEMEKLVRLPGVGRKTANVLLGTGFGVPGIVVDTHVTRIANLLDLTRQKDAVKIERDLEKALDRDEWILFTHLIIDHGRAVCKARRPRCEECVLNDLCPSAQGI
ncbi:MAG: endonuclease III [Candidatus Marinimicrobia bacterium]|nr:endonuclease III [Candidatus Neomarinimicrobiota bacterium]MCF7840984.1 endonuclease III [Candidatus Neomarinimicrobiota bacterium]